VHHRQYLAALSDQAEPLGPCDESGRRGVHQSVTLSLVLVLGLRPGAGAFGALPLALGLPEGKGASGSAVAVLTGFVAVETRGAFVPVTAGFGSGLAAGGAVNSRRCGTV
jgi:hypothetical protein